MPSAILNVFHGDSTYRFEVVDNTITVTQYPEGDSVNFNRLEYPMVYDEATNVWFWDGVLYVIVDYKRFE
jgi:hypothetical protein